MSFPVLNASVRTIQRRHLQSLRDSGVLPGELYGSGEENVTLQFSKPEFEKFFLKHRDTGILQLMVDGKAENVVIQEIQRDPLTSAVLHVDFLRIRMDKPIVMNVPLVFNGVSPAVKELGGVLVKNVLTLEVECLPADLPHELVVDISKLTKFDDTFTVQQLDLPGGVRVTSALDAVLAVTIAPRSEEELAALEEKVTEDVATVEGVVKKEKVKEGEAGEGAADSSKEGGAAKTGAAKAGTTSGSDKPKKKK